MVLLWKAAAILDILHLVSLHPGLNLGSSSSWHGCGSMQLLPNCCVAVVSSDDQVGLLMVGMMLWH
jgi:hypothetical protein